MRGQPHDLRGMEQQPVADWLLTEQRALNGEGFLCPSALTSSLPQQAASSSRPAPRAAVRSGRIHGDDDESEASSFTRGAAKGSHAAGMAATEYGEGDLTGLAKALAARLVPTLAPAIAPTLVPAARVAAEEAAGTLGKSLIEGLVVDLTARLKPLFETRQSPEELVEAIATRLTPVIDTACRDAGKGLEELLGASVEHTVASSVAPLKEMLSQLSVAQKTQDPARSVKLLRFEDHERAREGNALAAETWDAEVQVSIDFPAALYKATTDSDQRADDHIVDVDLTPRLDLKLPTHSQSKSHDLATSNSLSHYTVVSSNQSQSNGLTNSPSSASNYPLPQSSEETLGDSTTRRSRGGAISTEHTAQQCSSAGSTVGKRRTMGCEELVDTIDGTIEETLLKAERTELDGHFMLDAHSLEGLLQGNRLCDLFHSWMRLGPEPRRKTCFGQFVNSYKFESIVISVITLNSAFIGYAAQYAVDHPHKPMNSTIQAGELFFTSFYVIEILIRLIIHRWWFFTNDRCRWNVLDLALVIASIVDLGLTYSMQEGGTVGENNGVNLTFLRLVRMARASKIVRALRVMRHFRELRVLLKCIASSMWSLFWCTLTLFIFGYMFAIVLVTGVSMFMAHPDRDPMHQKAVLQWWGTVPKAIITLFKACTGGEDWGTMADPLLQTGYIYYGVFMIYVIFVQLAVLNMVVGIFVDNAMRATKKDVEGMAFEEMNNERATTTEFVKLFGYILSHAQVAAHGGEVASHAINAFRGPRLKDGYLTEDMLYAALVLPKLRAKFAVLGLEIWSARDFYQLLISMSAEGIIDLYTFVQGCMELRGTAQRFTVGLLNNELGRVQIELDRVRATLEQSLAKSGDEEAIALDSDLATGASKPVLAARRTARLKTRAKEFGLMPMGSPTAAQL